MAGAPSISAAAPPSIGCTIRWCDATVEVRCSTRADGDFHVEQDLPTLRARRRAFVDLPWSQPDEVHGIDVLEVAAPGEHDLALADALVTRVPGTVLGIWVGDCAPVAFVSASGRVGGAHAGWKGLAAGVLERTVAALRGTDRGRPFDATDIVEAADDVVAVLGPCIHPCCYEFGAADLASIADRFGPSVIATTRAGAPALDVPAAVRAALQAVGVPVVAQLGGCTACDATRWFSHRARAERGRQMMAIWLAPDEPAAERAEARR